MSNISNEDWNWLEEKYGKLLHHIAYRIGGDSITNDHEDSYQNLKQHFGLYNLYNYIKDFDITVQNYLYLKEMIIC